MLDEEKKRSEDLQFSVEEAKISSEEQSVSIGGKFTKLNLHNFFYHRHLQIFRFFFFFFKISHKKITNNLGFTFRKS